MSGLTLWNSLLPAAVTAILIRIDARLVGPYFATSEIVYGFEGLEAADQYSHRRLQFALIRRFLWPVAGGVVVSLVDASDARARGTAVGVLAAGLLLWPIVFHGLPWGVPRRRATLLLLYGTVVVAFGLGGWFGAELVAYVRGEIEEAGASQFVRDLVLPATGLWALKTFAESSLAELRRNRGGKDAVD